MERRPAMAGSACQTAWSWLIADPARISSLRLRDWPCAATSGFWKRQRAAARKRAFLHHSPITHISRPKDARL